MSKQTIIYDTEIIGKQNPVFLICGKNLTTKETFSVWHDKKKQIADFQDTILDPQYKWVSFNGIKFDQVLISMLLWGHNVQAIKTMATRIIEMRLQPWDAYKLANIKQVDYDHIDLIEVAPGVMTSLKTYAGRMNYPTMVDLPFHHDQDLTPKERKVLESYCLNDLGVTEALWNRLQSEITLREELSLEHGMDLRSKSDAQVAEAILKKTVGVQKRTTAIPFSVKYTVPDIIKTKSNDLAALMINLEETDFAIDNKTGSPILPDWLEKPFTIKDGVYQVGIGGLHSKHDKKVHHVADDKYAISDFDAASYYPKIILSCDLIPVMSQGKGDIFIKEYEDIFNRRLAAKRAGDKKTANSLKISLNGTYGKLGSIYSPFYSPDLMLAVCLTGQLNLLCLIDEVTKIKGVSVISANTDGITVKYPHEMRDKVLKVFAANAKRTGFEYEEVLYRSISMKDVNNYIAVTMDGKIKAKGLYADAGLQKNPTMPVCSKAAAAFIANGVKVDDYIRAKDRVFTEFTGVRAVKGGGEQQGVQFGRVARWYMSTDPIYKTWPLQYSSNGNQVPKTEGARVCMTLPDAFPDDLDYDWYVAEAKQILVDLGL